MATCLSTAARYMCAAVTPTVLLLHADFEIPRRSAREDAATLGGVGGVGGEGGGAAREPNGGRSSEVCFSALVC